LLWLLTGSFDAKPSPRHLAAFMRRATLALWFHIVIGGAADLEAVITVARPGSIEQSSGPYLSPRRSQ
jgi:hypothetical protein